MAKTSKKRGAKKKSGKSKSAGKKKTKKNVKKSQRKTKKTSLEKRYESSKKKGTEKILVDNFVSLQKVMVNLASKFDSLSTQISKLLELFEISAKSLAQKDFEKDRDNKESKEILKKLDNISQQAGLIGKGLVLIHESSSGKGFSTGESVQNEKDKFHGMEKSRMGMMKQPMRPMKMPNPSKFPVSKIDSGSLGKNSGQNADTGKTETQQTSQQSQQPNPQQKTQDQNQVAQDQGKQTQEID